MYFSKARIIAFPYSTLIFICLFQQPAPINGRSNECHFEPDGDEQCYFILEAGEYYWVKTASDEIQDSMKPSTDHSLAPHVGGNYLLLYRNTTIRDLHGVNREARLRSPMYRPDKHRIKNFCIIFWFYIYGEHAGTLSVLIGNDIMWTQNGGQQKTWQKVMIPLRQQLFKFQVFIEASGDQGYECNVAIDDLKITKGDCDWKGAEITEDDFSVNVELKNSTADYDYNGGNNTKSDDIDTATLGTDVITATTSNITKKFRPRTKKPIYSIVGKKFPKTTGYFDVTRSPNLPSRESVHSTTSRSLITKQNLSSYDAKKLPRPKVVPNRYYQNENENDHATSISSTIEENTYNYEDDAMEVTAEKNNIDDDSLDIPQSNSTLSGCTILPNGTCEGNLTSSQFNAISSKPTSYRSFVVAAVSLFMIFTITFLIVFVKCERTMMYSGKMSSANDQEEDNLVSNMDLEMVNLNEVENH